MPKPHIRLKVKNMEDYANPLVKIKSLTKDLQDKLTKRKIDEATAILDDIGVQMNLIYDWIDRQ